MDASKNEYTDESNPLSLDQNNRSTAKSSYFKHSWSDEVIFIRNHSVGRKMSEILS